MGLTLFILAMAWLKKQPDNAAASAEAAQESAEAAAQSAAEVDSSDSDDLAYILG